MEDDMKPVGNKAKLKRNKKLKLGKGKFGIVCEGLYDGKRVAVKRIELEEMEEGKSTNYDRELKIISSSDHPNIIRYLFHDQDDNFFYIAMELCESSLRAYFSNYGYGVTEDEATLLGILYQATNGVAYLHQKEIMHKDIKPGNMLLHVDSDKVRVKVADFGFSKVFDPKISSSVSSAKGSLGYSASEVCLKLRSRPQSDIFSLGVVFYEFSTSGSHPFGSDDLKKELNIKGKKKPNLESVRITRIPSLKGLVGKMVDHSWDNRPAAAVVLSELQTIYSEIFSPQTEDLEKHEIPQSFDSSIFFSYQKHATKAKLQEETQDASALIYSEAARSSLFASPMKGHGPSSAKKMKIEKDSNDCVAALKQYLHEDNVLSATQYNSDRPELELRNAESAIFELRWDEVLECVDRARVLLRPKGSVAYQVLFDMAKEASNMNRSIRAIFFYACASSQCRQEFQVKTASFNTGNCIYGIYEIAKTALSDKATREELHGDVRYKVIVEKFVVPFIMQEYRNQIEYQRENKLGAIDAANHNGYASSWISVLLDIVGNYEDCANFAKDNREKLQRILKKGCSADQNFARLLQQEGKARTRLGQYDEAKTLLKRALRVIGKVSSVCDSSKRQQIENQKIHAQRLLKENEVERKTNTIDLS